MQQMREAFPWNQAPRYVLRDRDAIYGQDFAGMMKGMGMEEVMSAPRSPWQNPYVERIVGSIRRECLDHVIRVERAVVAPLIAQLFCLLSPIENASLVGEGFTRAKTNSAVGNGTSCGAAAGRWAAPPLRTTGGVSNPGILST